MIITKELLKAMKAIQKKYGNVSASYLQYKYRVSFKEAERLRGEFYDR